MENISNENQIQEFGEDFLQSEVAGLYSNCIQTLPDNFWQQTTNYSEYIID